MRNLLLLLLISQAFYSLASLFAVVLSMCHDEDFLLKCQGGANLLGVTAFLIFSFFSEIENACTIFIACYLILSITLGIRVFLITRTHTGKTA